MLGRREALRARTRYPAPSDFLFELSVMPEASKIEPAATRDSLACTFAISVTFKYQTHSRATRSKSLLCEYFAADATHQDGRQAYRI